MHQVMEIKDLVMTLKIPATCSRFADETAFASKLLSAGIQAGGYLPNQEMEIIVKTSSELA